MAELIQKTDTLNQGREKLNEAIKDAETAKNISAQADDKATQALTQSESTQTQLDTIVINGDSSVEAAQARVDAKGESYATLKARLDAEHTSVTSQLAQTAKKSWLDITELGAVLDGTDNTVILQQAVDSLEFGTVYIPEGTVTITQPIAMKSGVSIKGSSTRKTIVKGNTGGKPYFLLEVGTGNTIKDISFSDFSIDTTGNTLPTRHMGMIQSEDGCNLENITIQHLDILCPNNYESGVFILNNTSGKIKNVRISNNKIVTFGDDSYGFLLQKRGEDIWVTDNYVSVNHVGANNNIGLYADCKRFNITGNRCIKGGHSAIAVSPGSYGEISGNYVEGVNTSNEAGIEVEWKAVHGGSDTSHHVVISNNIVKDCYYGIMVTDRDGNAPELVHDIVIDGNIITDCYNDSIYLNYCKNVNISNNVVKGRNTLGLGIRVDVNCGDDITINGNNFSKNSSGIYIQAKGKNYKITNNTVKESQSSAITLETTSGGNTIVTGNSVYTVNTGGHGISVKTNNNIIMGNQVFNALGNSINDTGTGNTVINNITGVAS